MYKPHFFLQKIAFQNWGAALHGILCTFFLLRRTKSSEWESPRHQYCLLWNPQSCLCMQTLNPPKESWYPFYDWAHGTSIIMKPPVEISSVCAYCRQRQRSDFVATWIVTQNITLVFPPRKLFFRMHIYYHGSDCSTYYWYINIFWLRDCIWHSHFPEVRRPHHWQITVNAGSDKRSAANAIANILLSLSYNVVGAWSV
jgi:hypothetical protein